MSFSSSRKKALDSSQPLNHRVSSARSCAVCVCEKFNIKRSAVLEAVLQKTGIDLNNEVSPEDIIKAIEALEYFRLNGV